MDILVLGPYPPPLGGVGVHIERLTAALDRHGVRLRVLNHYRGGDGGRHVIGSLRRNPLRYWWAARNARAPIVHYHHSGLLLLLATALGRRSDARYLCTVHGEALRWHGRVFLTRAVVRWALSRFERVIAVSPKLAGDLRRFYNVRSPQVLPAYLPPVVIPPVGAALRRFLADPGPIVAVSGFRLSSAANFRSYGLDVAIDAFLDLAHDDAEIRLGLFLAQAPRRGGARELRSRFRGLERAGVADRVGVFVGEPLVAVLGRPGCVYLRPTRTEGDATSVREAIEAGCPVVASEVARRPRGVRTTAELSASAWAQASRDALSAARPDTGGKGAEPAPDGAEISSYLALYGHPPDG